MCCARVGPTSCDPVPGHNALRLWMATIYPVILPAQSRVDALFICSPAHPAMPPAVQGSHLISFDELRTGLRRRSSCPSIPRSVSICSSNYAIDFSGEFSRVPTESGDVGIYMSPLFRGLGGIGEEHELMSARATRGFTPRAEAIDCDDSLSDNLSNYQFDIVGLNHILEPTKAPEAKLSTDQSPTHTHPHSAVAPGKPLKPKASQLFPPRDPSPSPEHFRPSVPPKPTRPLPDIPINAGSTRPLKIDRSRKRTGPSVASQRTHRNVAPTSKPISRATTQGNLREAYRRDWSLADRKVPTRGVTHAKTPDKKVTQVNTQPPILLHRTYSSHSIANPYHDALSKWPYPS